MSRPPSRRGGKPPLVAERRSPKAAPAKPKRRAKASNRKARPARKRGLIGWLLFPFTWALRLVWRLFWRLSLVVVAIVGLAVFYLASQLPDISAQVDGRTRGSVTMVDREGDVFAWRGDQFGGMITAQSVSPNLRNAVIATEDRRFYSHFGISPRGTLGAMRTNMREGRSPLSGAGGSTISQQTAKLLCMGEAFDPQIWANEREYEADCRRTTLWRKVKEAAYAMAMEVRYTKDEILTIYLNRAYLGGGARGFEAASQRYFGKSAAVVTPSEAAMLAGLLKAPSTYAPTSNLQRSRDRAAVVVMLMEDQGYITAAEAADARANPAGLSDAAEANAGGYYADWVMEQGPDFFTSQTTEDVVIRTTFDAELQTAAEDALQWVFDNKVREGSEAQAAIVVMSADGAVRAMVGGRNTRGAGLFNRATQARRQTGSAFKPFIYATALDLGFSPNDLVNDAPLRIEVPGSGAWEPQNYDLEFKGSITLTRALAESRNIPAVILSEEVGRELVSVVATGFGIESDLAAGPALALGASESTLIEMTGAYAGFLNGGSSVEPYGLIDLRLQGEDTAVMDSEGTGIGERVISESAARQTTWMMTQVVEQGTGQRARMGGWEIAGKTGTTNSQRDAWFIGFTGDYVTGVWMGNDDNTPLAGVTGGGLPADIWHETMTRITSGQQPTPLPMEPPPAASGAGTLSTDSVEADQQMNDAISNILQGLDQ
ncbi:MAG: PBP1A family penicillin-binding protein [Paracoccaceae bacterium]|nr:PBP1A family penicillin-binding protein [Loktanella sp.]